MNIRDRRAIHQRSRQILAQAPADPSLAPGAAPADCRHFEYEGWDWADLARKISAL